VRGIDFLYLSVIVVLVLLIHALALQCEQTRNAVATMKIKVDNMQSLLVNDAKVDHFVRQLKSRDFKINQ
jgi:hypothetical protein